MASEASDIERKDQSHRDFAQTIFPDSAGQCRTHIAVLQARARRRLEHAPRRDRFRARRVYQPAADSLRKGPVHNREGNGQIARVSRLVPFPQNQVARRATSRKCRAAAAGKSYRRGIRQCTWNRAIETDGNLEPRRPRVARDGHDAGRRLLGRRHPHRKKRSKERGEKEKTGRNRGAARKRSFGVNPPLAPASWIHIRVRRYT